MIEINTIVEKSPELQWDGKSLLRTKLYPLEEAPCSKDQNLSTERKPKLKEFIVPQNQTDTAVVLRGHATALLAEVSSVGPHVHKCCTYGPSLAGKGNLCDILN